MYLRIAAVQHRETINFKYVISHIWDVSKMANITLSLPESVHNIVKKHKEIRWSEVARAAISDHARKLDAMDKLASKSKLTLKDVEEINKKVKEGLFRRYAE